MKNPSSLSPLRRVADPLPGEAIRAFREAVGMTQADLAGHIGLSRCGTVSDYETGRAECTGTARAAILFLAEHVGFPIA
jgi:DNA-binding transcriptional regulator YiaG